MRAKILRASSNGQALAWPSAPARETATGGAVSDFAAEHIEFPSQLPRRSPDRLHFSPRWFEPGGFHQIQLCPALPSPRPGHNRPLINMAFTLFAHHAAGGAVLPFDFVGRVNLSLGAKRQGRTISEAACPPKS